MNSMKQLITSPGGTERLDGQFTRLPSYAFSKTILEPNAKHLRVIRAEGVTWSDWGNQERVVSDLSKMAIESQNHKNYETSLIGDSGESIATAFDKR